MPDRPILFSAPMVNAILREIHSPGTGKTQTRRVLNPQPEFLSGANPDFTGWRAERSGDDLWHIVGGMGIGAKGIKTTFAPGDRGWVRESWCLCGQMDEVKISECSKYETVGYLADGDIREYACSMVSRGRGRPSIHMPRWASRITLDVTEVRVERLQDIGEMDAIAEGCEEGQRVDEISGIGEGWSAQTDFRLLWDSINGTPRKPDGPDISWAANPWVMAISFTPSLCNIDQMAKAA